MTIIASLATLSALWMAEPMALLQGFTAEGAASQRVLEERFDKSLDRQNLRAWMQKMTARPHHVGSPYGREIAQFTAAQFRSWGYDTQIEELSVLFPTPRTRLVELVAPKRFRAGLSEPALKEDHTSNQSREQLPTYVAYSIDGDVTADLVYVNYGVPKDYEELDRRGIDVKGKIVIARYGGSWRGIKPKVAAEKGAVGCLIYSDPRDDGYFEGDTYPKGPFRPSDGAQRGSVMDLPVMPGDPLTPGVGSTKGATRIALGDAKTLTRIPVLPLSYKDAAPLLGALGGPMAPAAWRGALPMPYHLGPGPAKVRLKVAFDWKQAPAYNVIAKLAGRERPDEWVIRGNHHDAWVNGASDPVSGAVALMEEARAVGALAKGGWRPRRTIIYTVWDAEEPGLIGSSEWVETHAQELAAKAVVYVNSDSNRSGLLKAEGSHTLEQLVNEVARDVQDPDKRVSVAQRSRAHRLVSGSDEDKKAARVGASMPIGALGSGSDYTAFLQHLGIASLNLGFSGDQDGGSYHSIYDSFDHYTRFADPNFEYGLVLARTGGRVVLRMAEANVLPFEFTRFAETVGRYVKEVMKLADETRERTERENRLIRDRTLEIAATPREPFVAPKPKEPVPRLAFDPLQKTLARLGESARAFDRAYDRWRRSGRPLPSEASRPLDRALMQSERALIRSEGLPLRPWFRHQIYAPGLYTGYGVKTLPGVREAIEQREWKRAEEQIGRVAETLGRFAGEIDRATALLPAEAGGTPRARTISLFNGRDLSEFYTYLGPRAGDKEPIGKDKDPLDIFTVVDGAIRISGEAYGFLSTEKEFDDFRLVADMKWGQLTHAPREANARASAIMYRVSGADGIWPPAKLECQIIEGGMGTLYVGKEASGIDVTDALKPRFCPNLTVSRDGKRAGPGCVYREGRSPSWKNEKGFHAPGDVEKPAGEWNTIDITAQGGSITHSINGKVVLRATGAQPRKGRILILSEGAEAFFRRIEVTRLGAN